MSNEFRICDRCKAINIKTLVPKLKQLDSRATIQIGCQNVCGIGKTKPFAIVNHIPIIAESEVGLIERIKENISK